MIEAPALMGNAEMRHGFFTRRGGYSTGVFSELNCNFRSGDDADTIRRNRSHVATALGLLPDQLVTAKQVHSADVAVIDAPPEAPPEVDALVTNRPGLALGILTADCAPVLLSDHEAEVVGGVHAGWRGALTGVLEAAVDAMVRLGARRDAITAVVGPTIHQDAYEVGPEFHEQFIASDPANDRFFVASDRAGHHRFDLPGYVLARLARLGLRHIGSTGLCTYSDESAFFSYRRTTHRGEKQFGCQISAITLGPAAFDAGR